jgi:ketosteroid isomerase-like protein
MKLRLALGLALLAAALGIWLWWANRPHLTPVQQVAAAVLSIKDAIVARDAGRVLSFVSDDYSDGSYTKPDIVRLVTGGLRGIDHPRVVLDPFEVTVTGEEATARLRAHFWTGEGPAGPDAIELNINAQFRREHGRWKLISAAGWEPATGAAD